MATIRKFLCDLCRAEIRANTDDGDRKRPVGWGFSFKKTGERTTFDFPALYEKHLCEGCIQTIQKTPLPGNAE